jgi:hypothetical protein
MIAGTGGIMTKPIVWAATPEARAKLAAGYEPPETNPPDCPKMQKARRQAERAMKEIGEGKAAVSGGDSTDEERE